ncbi:hypothetical protein PLESTB_001519100 [Pleodorina starrii]|uniref:Fungal lipase-type domain-containing protein n=1 Tax=Pleodorina starrii TaxID=330485 RepID=A0A9W6BX18_9CHLO|nr:hypothetical protein PLESTB_001519100 [Pleodorina starrii]
MQLTAFVGNVSTKPIGFTGHSLGGVYATLFAAYTHLRLFNVSGVYTFGSPIVGNAAWKAVYPLASKTYRYGVKGDPVIGLPIGNSWSIANHVGITQSADPCAASIAAAAGRRRLLEAATTAAVQARSSAAASSAAAAAAVGSSGAVTTQAFADHKVFGSYTANIYYCVLTSQEAATVPSFKTVLGFKL